MKPDRLIIKNIYLGAQKDRVFLKKKHPVGYIRKKKFFINVYISLSFNVYFEN